MGDALGPTTGRATGESASAMQQQSGRAELLSVGFSTRSTKKLHVGYFTLAPMSGFPPFQQYSN